MKLRKILRWGGKAKFVMECLRLGITEISEIQKRAKNAGTYISQVWIWKVKQGIGGVGIIKKEGLEKQPTMFVTSRGRKLRLVPRETEPETVKVREIGAKSPAIRIETLDQLLHQQREIALRIRDCRMKELRKATERIAYLKSL